MEENNQLEIQDFQEYPLPKVEWKLNFWLTFIPYVTSFILFFFPQLINLEEYKILRYILGALLLFTPFLYQLIDWLVKLNKAIKNRVENYDYLIETLKQSKKDIKDYKESVFELFSMFNKFLEPYGVIEAHYNEKSFFVVVRKKIRTNLIEGDRFFIINKEDNSFIGIFKIINKNDDCYTAIGQLGLDPMWAGFIRDKGRVDFLPYMQAFYYLEGDNYGN